ncbi:MAG: RimK family alpha-L-glutamate ligase [Candidatus Thorarchaeota archaeon]
MNIGILSKRKTMMAGKLKKCLEDKGYKVQIYTLENLAINENLLKHDLYILKSKSLFFLYAGYYLEAHNKIVIPKPHFSFLQKNRIQSHFTLKKAGLNTPEIYLGTVETFKNQLKSNSFPLIKKPIMGSGSKGVELIKSLKDLKSKEDGILYLEKFIKGIHYTVYFIENNICTLIKPPLSHEHVHMKKGETTADIREVIKKWRDFFKGEILFGHLDIVREESNNKLYVVDPGSFPEFTNWKCELSPVEEICNLIINKVKNI